MKTLGLSMVAMSCHWESHTQSLDQQYPWCYKIPYPSFQKLPKSLRQPQHWCHSYYTCHYVLPGSPQDAWSLWEMVPQTSKALFCVFLPPRHYLDQGWMPCQLQLGHLFQSQYEHQSIQYWSHHRDSFYLYQPSLTRPLFCKTSHSWEDACGTTGISSIASAISMVSASALPLSVTRLEEVLT